MFKNRDVGILLHTIGDIDNSLNSLEPIVCILSVASIGLRAIRFTQLQIFVSSQNSLLKVYLGETNRLRKCYIDCRMIQVGRTVCFQPNVNPGMIFKRQEL